MSEKINNETMAKFLTVSGVFKPLHYKSFVQTGTMSVSRKHLEMLISALGGENHGAVKSNTDFLIVPNDPNFRQGSKYKAAVKAGTMIITEREFCTLILPSFEDLMGDSDAEGHTV